MIYSSLGLSILESWERESVEKAPLEPDSSISSILPIC